MGRLLATGVLTATLATALAGPRAAVASETTGFCVVGDDPVQHPLVGEENGRIFVNDRHLPALKESGGYCLIDFGVPAVFKLNSVVGKIRLDGRHVANGNSLCVSGMYLTIEYAPSNSSNGFDTFPAEVAGCPR